jgi:hypothetical protein
LFIRDARSLLNAGEYRRAIVDACTAELSVTALIDRKFDHADTGASHFHVVAGDFTTASNPLVEYGGATFVSTPGSDFNNAAKRLKAPRPRSH